LPGLPIPRRYGRWVARDDLVEYLEEYAGHFGIEPTFGVELDGLERTDDHWRVHTSARTYEADCVVLATGMCHTPQIPALPGLPSFTGRVVHSADYRQPSPYRGQRVLVLGAGNSATEIATELAEVAEVALSVRRPPNIVRRDIAGFPSQAFGIALRRVPEPAVNVLTTMLRRISLPDLGAYGLPGPSGDGFSQYLRTRTMPILDHGFVAAVQAGRITVVPQVASIDGPEVRFADDRAIRPDVIIAGTGFGSGLSSLVGRYGVLDDRGRPRIGGGTTAPDAPDLYLVGMTVVLSGLLREVGIEAREVGRAIARDRSVASAPAR
jgi:putative flavoprotein involved in K+ transport